MRGFLGKGHDRGQVTIEFLGMTPAIIVTLVLVWQCVLVGYAYTLAGNAADEAVRAATVVPEGARPGACQEAGLKHLTGAWKGKVEECGGAGYVQATVTVEVPVLFPGSISFPFEAKGHAGAVEEAKR